MWQHSAVSSFVELVPIILSQPGVEYFLSEKICQDPLEKFFGCLRQRGRVNDNPMLNEVFKGAQGLRVIGDVNVKAIAGNCRGKRSADDAVLDNSSKLHLHKRRKSKQHNKENI